MIQFFAFRISVENHTPTDPVRTETVLGKNIVPAPTDPVRTETVLGKPRACAYGPGANGNGSRYTSRENSCLRLRTQCYNQCSSEAYRRHLKSPVIGSVLFSEALRIRHPHNHTHTHTHTHTRTHARTRARAHTHNAAAGACNAKMMV